MGERGRERGDREVESVTKGEVGEGEREVVEGLIKITPNREKKEKGRKIVYWLVEKITYYEVQER